MIHPIARNHENQIVDYVLSMRETMQQARQDREMVWMDCLEAYMGKFKDEWMQAAKQDGRSARFVPMFWDATENIVAQLMAMLFPNEDWFRPLPARTGGENLADDESVESIRVLLKYQHEQMRFSVEFRKLVKWLVITGNCPWSLVRCRESAVDYPRFAQDMAAWVEQQQAAAERYGVAIEAWRGEAKMADMQGEPRPPAPSMPLVPRPVAPETLIYSGPKLVVGDPFNFLIDDRANDPRSAFRMTTVWRTAAYLRHHATVDETGYATYENLENLKDSGQHSDDDRGRNNLIAQAFDMTLPDKDAVKMYEAEGDFELVLGAEEAGIYKSWICTIGNDRTLMRFEPSPSWSGDPSTQLATLIPIPGQAYGGGLLEPVLGIGDGVNARFNQVVDAIAVAINPETKYVNDGVFDPEDAESGPGGLIPVGDINNLQPLERNLSGLPLAYHEIEAMKADFQSFVRSGNPSIGRSSERSATEVAREASISGGSLQEIARFVEDNTLLPILRAQIQHNQQYLSKKEMVRISQDSTHTWAEVSPASVRQSWDVRIVGSQNQLLKEQRLEKLLQFLQMTAGNEMTAMMINLPYLLRKVYRDLTGEDDVDNVFLNAEELAAIAMAQQQAVAQEEAVSAAPQGGGPPVGGSGGNPGMPQGGPPVPAGLPPGVAAAAPYAQQADNARMDTPTSL